MTLAKSAIVIAAASNNVIKGIYAYASSQDHRTGAQCLALLSALAALGLMPLLWWWYQIRHHQTRIFPRPRIARIEFPASEKHGGETRP